MAAQIHALPRRWHKTPAGELRRRATDSEIAVARIAEAAFERLGVSAISALGDCVIAATPEDARLFDREAR